MSRKEVRSETRLITPAELVRRHRMRVFDYAGASRKAVTRDLGREPICRSGCAWCCYAKIVMDAGHGAMIALWLELEGQWTPALVERLRAADAAMAPVDHAAWLGSKVPCAFLKPGVVPGQGHCSVYPVRPLCCSGTLSRALDPRECAEVGGKALAMMDIDGDEPLLRYMIEYPEALLLHAGETQTRLMTLPGAVLYGHALLCDEPRPNVFSISKEEWHELPEPRPELEALFDDRAAEGPPR